MACHPACHLLTFHLAGAPQRLPGQLAPGRESPDLQEGPCPAGPPLQGPVGAVSAAAAPSFPPAPEDLPGCTHEVVVASQEPAVPELSLEGAGGRHGRQQWRQRGPWARLGGLSGLWVQGAAQQLGHAVDVVPEPTDIHLRLLLGCFWEVLLQGAQHSKDEAQRDVEGPQEVLPAEPPQGVLAGEVPRVLPAVFLQFGTLQALEADIGIHECAGVLHEVRLALELQEKLVVLARALARGHCAQEQKSEDQTGQCSLHTLCPHAG